MVDPLDDRFNEPEHWRVSKSIPVSLIITLVVLSLTNTAVGAWYMSNFATRLTIVEEYIRNSGQQSAQIAVIQEKVSNTQGAITRLETRLEELMRHTIK